MRDILIYAGACCLIFLLSAIVVWSIKTIIRNIIEVNYAVSVKNYIKDNYNRIVSYEIRIKDLEKEIYEIKNHHKGDREDEN